MGAMLVQEITEKQVLPLVGSLCLDKVHAMQLHLVAITMTAMSMICRSEKLMTAWCNQQAVRAICIEHHAEILHSNNKTQLFAFINGLLPLCST